MRKPLASELVEMAAGRPASGVELSADALRQAVEHRVGGLVMSGVLEDQIQVPAAWERHLRAIDAASQLWHKQQLTAMRHVSEVFDEVGLPHLFVKGAANAERWYRRPAERVSLDVDVVCSPHHPDRWLPAITALAPGYAASLRGTAPRTLRRELALKVELTEGIDVDVHFDVLKYGVPCRQSAEIWARRQPLTLSNGLEIAVLDPETALVQQLIELNRDRFCYLQGYAEVARIMRLEMIDWEHLDRFVTREGIREATFLSLRAVLDVLQLVDPHPVEPSGWRAKAWNVTWPPQTRLQGNVGALNWRHRERLLAFLPVGRRREAVGALGRYFFPPSLRLRASIGA